MLNNFSMRDVWAKRNLFIFYLPPYSPQLNIIERVWKEMKARWINEKDYQSADNLFYATHLVLNDIGKSLKMNFKKI
jgi:transposase